MLEFARWKYWLVAAVLLVAFVFALPNFFGEDPALQVARKDRSTMDAVAQKSVEAFLQERQVPFSKTFVDAGRVMVRFADVGDQLQARDAVNDGLGQEYITALSFAPRAPIASFPPPPSTTTGRTYLNWQELFMHWLAPESVERRESHSVSVVQ